MFISFVMHLQFFKLVAADLALVFKFKFWWSFGADLLFLLVLAYTLFGQIAFILNLLFQNAEFAEGHIEL